MRRRQLFYISNYVAWVIGLSVILGVIWSNGGFIMLVLCSFALLGLVALAFKTPLMSWTMGDKR